MVPPVMFRQRLKAIAHLAPFVLWEHLDNCEKKIWLYLSKAYKIINNEISVPLHFSSGILGGLPLRLSVKTNKVDMITELCQSSRWSYRSEIVN